MIKKFFMPQKPTVKSTYLWTALAGLTYAASSFIMSMVTSNYSGIAAAGILALALSIGSQLVTIGYFNIRVFQASDIKEKYSFGDYVVFRIITIAAMLLVGAVWIIKDSYTGIKLAAICLAIVFRATEAVSDLIEGRYQQNGRYDVSCRGVFVKTMLFLAAFLITLFITDNLIAALAAMAISYILTIIIFDSQLIGSFGGISFKSTVKKQIGLFFEGLPLFINAFLNADIINRSKYVVDRLFDSEVLGIYNALYMMAFVVNMFSAFVLKPIITSLAQKHTSGDNKGFLKLVLRQVVIIFCLTVVCIIGAYLVGVPVLTWLFGVDLSDYKAALCLMLVSGGFTALYQLFQYGLIIMRHQYSSFVCCAVTAVICYLITPILTKKYIIIGAAASYTISIAVMSVLFIVFFAFFFIKESKKQKSDNKTEL